MNRGIRALVASLVIILVASGAFIGGVLFSNTLGSVPAIGSFVSSQTVDAGVLLDRVSRIIQDSALAPSSEESVTTNAIRGALQSLDDPYAAYYDAQQYKDLQEDQSGEFFGIGVSLGINKAGQPVAATVFAKTPASKAGIKTGDVFTAVGGVRKAKWDLEDFVKLVRGPLGTKVTLEITRGTAKPFDVTLARDRIAVPNTLTKMYGDVGYVRLMTFNELSAQDVANAIKDFDAKGAKGYVLDLRGNPGGLLVSAVDVASIFIQDGVIVRVDERGKPEEEDRATGAVLTDKPMVVLVDENSASASEIVAGALKDYKRATVVGVTTYGKGSVQKVMPLENGGAVKLTIAHYLTPLSKVINKVGVIPDVVVKMDAKLQASATTDTQLKRALEVVRAKF
ncbi:MAG TPA: S41 family peptidase [Coriobacteriia bacterium]